MKIDPRIVAAVESQLESIAGVTNFRESPPTPEGVLRFGATLLHYDEWEAPDDIPAEVLLAAGFIDGIAFMIGVTTRDLVDEVCRISATARSYETSTREAAPTKDETRA